MKAFESRKTVAATAKDVFLAFENHSLLEKWWGPDGFTTISESFDFRPEGVWKFDMHGPDGKAYPNEMMFQEIAAPNRIVMRHNIEPYFTLTVAIADNGGSSVLTWRQEFDDEDVARSIALIVEPANEQILEKLESLVTSDNFVN